METDAGTIAESKRGKRSSERRLSGGLNRCSSVSRFGTILKSSRPLSADEAYDLGQIFYSQSSGFSKKYTERLRAIFGEAEFEATVSNREPRYRMAPAIIIDYPEIILHRAGNPKVSARVCFTVGSGEDHKIWLRFNLERGLATATALDMIRNNSSAWEEMFHDFLIPTYKETAKKRLNGVRFKLHTLVRIFAFSCHDEQLKAYLESVDEQWSTFGNFVAATDIPSRFLNFFAKVDASARTSDITDGGRQSNYVYYRAPISRRGVFHDAHRRTFCSLVKFNISSVDATVYALSHEYAHPATHITDSSAHVGSGELSFEIGRLY